MSRSLCWRSLPADPDQQVPLPRAHHATFLLRGLQPQPPEAIAAQTSTMLTERDNAPAVQRFRGSTIPELSCVVVTFGGVLNDDVWVNDIHILTMVQDGEQEESGCGW